MHMYLFLFDFLFIYTIRRSFYNGSTINIGYWKCNTADGGGLFFSLIFRLPTFSTENNQTAILFSRLISCDANFPKHTICTTREGRKTSHVKINIMLQTPKLTQIFLYLYTCIRIITEKKFQIFSRCFSKTEKSLLLHTYTLVTIQVLKRKV